VNLSPPKGLSTNTLQQQVMFASAIGDSSSNYHKQKLSIVDLLELYVLSIQGFLGRNCDLEDFHWHCFGGKRRDMISVSSKRKQKRNKVAT